MRIEIVGDDGERLGRFESAGAVRIESTAGVMRLTVAGIAACSCGSRYEAEPLAHAPDCDWPEVAEAWKDRPAR